MKTVKIREITIGTGRPKICVPIVGKTEEEILQEARKIPQSTADLAEWRADWYEETDDWGKAESVLQQLREILGEIPLLFTFRSAAEGGEREISAEAYQNLNQKAAESGLADLIDVEAYFQDGIAEELIRRIHACGGKVIASNHDFAETPDEEEIRKRLRHMQEIGADIGKIAVMPQTPKDVLELLCATEQVTAADKTTIPVVTMSMGRLGAFSRISGELTGSAMTFGALGKTSAPGQPEAGRLKEVLELLRL